MTHVLAIARREIEERAFVFVAAVAIALVSPLALLMPYATVRDRLSVVVPMSFILGAAFTWGLALILGGTLIGRELSERRLSFYFTRPISGAAIWFGKLVAAMALLASAFAIVHVFPLGFGERELRAMSTLSRSGTAGAILGIAVGLMFAAHLLSTWIRSRSPILGLDFLAFIAFVVLLAIVMLPLGMVVAVRPAVYILVAVAAAFGVAAVGGGAWQLTRGRIDARRNHRELSLFVWSVVFAVAAASLAYSRWVIGVTPRELKKVRINQQGSFLEMWGDARGAQPTFLVDPASGAYMRGPSWETDSAGDVVAGTFLWPSRANVSSALMRKSQPVLTLRVARCDRDCTVLMNLDFTGGPDAVAVTPDASRVALATEGTLTVYDVRSRHALASARVDRVRPRVQFLSPDVVRIFDPFSDKLHDMLRVTDFDVRTRKSTAVVPPIPLANAYAYRAAGPILLTRSASGVEVRDLHNPLAVETIPLSKHDGVWVMRDGREAISHGGGAASIEIRRNGARQRTILFGRDATSARVSAEIGSGRLLVSTSGTKQGNGNNVYIVDADTGAMSAPIAQAWAVGPWPPDLGVAEPDVKYRAIEHRDTGKVDVIDLRTGAIRALFQ